MVLNVICFKLLIKRGYFRSRALMNCTYVTTIRLSNERGIQTVHNYPPVERVSLMNRVSGTIMGRITAIAIRTAINPEMPIAKSAFLLIMFVFVSYRYILDCMLHSFIRQGRKTINCYCHYKNRINFHV